MTNKHTISPPQSGFTLVEMSIVLVIIGLIIGGILTGQDLIKGAQVRAQISQIEKYQTAVNTFRNKYGYLPGDIPTAAQFGFQSRGSYFGEGDGNGLIEGNCSNVATPNASSPPGFQTGCGELAVIWEDLSEATLIDATVIGYDQGGANYPYIIGAPTAITLTSTPAIQNWLPSSKFGGNNFVYVYSMNGTNYFGLSTVTHIGDTVQSSALIPGLTVQQAYMVDRKIDDAIPQSGAVTACYLNFDVYNYRAIWAASGTQGNGGLNCTSTTAASSPAYATTDCFNNNGVTGQQSYATSQNATLLNCGLSFRFQ